VTAGACCHSIFSASFESAMLIHSVDSTNVPSLGSIQDEVCHPLQ
jgi:hypothetical protein